MLLFAGHAQYSAMRKFRFTYQSGSVNVANFPIPWNEFDFGWFKKVVSTSSYFSEYAAWLLITASSWCDLKTDCSLFQPLIMNLYNILIDSTSFDCDILTLYQMTTSFSPSQLLSLCIPYVIRNISQFTSYATSLNSHWHPPHPNWNRNRNGNRIISVACLLLLCVAISEFVIAKTSRPRGDISSTR